jgi:hypothetical protein
MLTLRMIGLSDYRVIDDGQRIGRIRSASERSPGIWLWHVQVHIPGPPFGSAASVEEAKQDFETGWRLRTSTRRTRWRRPIGRQPAQRTMTVPGREPFAMLTQFGHSTQAHQRT